MNIYIVLIVVTACITWTFTQEEITRHVRLWLSNRSEIFDAGVIWNGVRVQVRANSAFGWWVAGFGRLLTYMPVCYYCLAHWVMLGLLLLVQPAPLVGVGMVGMGLTYFTLVAGSVLLMSLFGMLRRTQTVDNQPKKGCGCGKG